MQDVVELFKHWQLHPAVDHFTVALLVVALLFDLAASLLSARQWIRYAALMLWLLGTAAAWGSELTGKWEAQRVKDLLSAAVKSQLHTHAELGEALPWVFSVLAVWRLGVQAFAWIGRSRPLFLLAAVVAAAAVIYQGYLGGELVYGYGVGTALLTKAAPQPAVGAAAGAAASTSEEKPAPAVPASAPPASAARPSALPAAPATAAESVAPSPAPTPQSGVKAAVKPSPQPMKEAPLPTAAGPAGQPGATPKSASSASTAIAPPSAAGNPKAGE